MRGAEKRELLRELGLARSGTCVMSWRAWSSKNCGRGNGPQDIHCVPAGEGKSNPAPKLGIGAARGGEKAWSLGRRGLCGIMALKGPGLRRAADMNSAAFAL